MSCLKPSSLRARLRASLLGASLSPIIGLSGIGLSVAQAAEAAVEAPSDKAESATDSAPEESPSPTDSAQSFGTESTLGEVRRPERRAGLWGVHASRRLTMPHNSLGAIFGPGQTPLFGQRYRNYSPDGGISYAGGQNRLGEQQNELWLRGGVVFGLFPNFEAGALFLTFKLVPEFKYSNFPVFLTYSWHFDKVDIGARLSFMTPVEVDAWSFNPGVPVVVRLGALRLDTGVFVPVLTDDGTSAGLNVPVRASYNLTARWHVGLESGFYEEEFGRGDGPSSALAAQLGYTTFWGARLIDLNARFSWDDFLRYAPGQGQSAIDADSFQAFFGVTMHSKVM